MDEREIEISVMENDKPMFDIFAVPGLDTLESFQEFIKDLSPKKREEKKLKSKTLKR